MKPFFLLLFLVLGNVTQTIARCGSRNITLSATPENLPLNGIFVLTFYASSQDLIPELGKKYPLYLKRGSEKVSLQVVEILKGDMRETQVVLKAAALLAPNSTYSFHLGNLPAAAPAPAYYDPLTQKKLPLQFKTGSTMDTDAPIWKGAPAEGGKTYTSLGCGPASFMKYRLAATNTDVQWVRTTVKNVSAGKATTALLLLNNGEIEVGHSMCSGSFALPEGTAFEVVFQLYDAAGNSSVRSKTFTFTAPTASSKVGTSY